MLFRLVLVLCWLPCCLLLPAAQAATYASASTSFNWIDPSGHSKVGYNTSPYKFNTASGCATNVPRLDDTLSDLIPIGFSFTFGTTAYTQLRIQTNGRLQFGNSSCGAGTQDIGPPQTYPYGYPDASMNNTMKVFGVDLDPTNLVDMPNYPSAFSKTNCTSIATCFISVATLGTAPNRRFVVTWYHVPEWVSYSNTSGSFDVQVILNEDGTFIYQYGASHHGGTGVAQVGWQLSSSDYEVNAFAASSEPPPFSAIAYYIPAPVLAYYQFEEGAWAAGGAGQVRDASPNNLDGAALGEAQATTTGFVCRGADIPLNTSDTTVDAISTGVALSNAALNLRGSGTVMFWYRANAGWSNGRAAQLLDATTVDGEWFYLSKRANGALAFEIMDSTGVLRSLETPAQSVGAGSWQHISISWNFNGLANPNSDRIAISINGGTPLQLSFTSSGTVPLSAGTLVLGDNPSGYAGPKGTVNSADGQIDEVQVFNYELAQAQILARKGLSHSCDSFNVDHLELRSTSWSGVACSPASITVLACADASYPCSSPYTKGLVATLGSSAAATSWVPGGNARLAIGYGQSSAAKGFYVSPGSTTLSAASLPATVHATRCNGIGGACVWTSTANGLIVSAPVITGGQPTAVTVQAVESVGAAPPQSCVGVKGIVNTALKLWATADAPAAFAGTGSSAGVSVGGAPQMATAQAGSYNYLPQSTPVSNNFTGLSFDSNASATLWVKHMDTGRWTLSAALDTTTPVQTLNGNTSVATVPVGFGIQMPAAWTAASATQGACAAGQGAACDTAAGANARAASAGDVVASAVIAALWTGNGDTDFSDNPVAPSFAGPVTLSPLLAAPSGGINGLLQTGSVTLAAGSSGSFPQSWTQSGALRINASGVYLGSTISSNSPVLGRISPKNFRTTLITAGCGSFSYSGQPISSVLVEAMDGGASAAFTPNFRDAFARAVNLSDGASGTSPGSFSNNLLTAADFSIIGRRGQALLSPSFSFSDALTAPHTLALRASDGEISSQDVTNAEASALVRSGRLRLSNAFGSDRANLSLPVQAQYWTGQSWLRNPDDSCSRVPKSAVALSGQSGTLSAANMGAANVLGDISITAGEAVLSLKCPYGSCPQMGLPAGALTGSVDLALNLGGSTQDNACAGSHPNTSGASLPWLRSRNGSCAASFDRDPSARATFGIYSPESRKTMHTREIF